MTVGRIAEPPFSCNAVEVKCASIPCYPSLGASRRAGGYLLDGFDFIIAIAIADSTKQFRLTTTANPDFCGYAAGQRNTWARWDRQQIKIINESAGDIIRSELHHRSSPDWCVWVTVGTTISWQNSTQP